MSISINGIEVKRIRIPKRHKDAMIRSVDRVIEKIREKEKESERSEKEEE